MPPVDAPRVAASIDELVAGASQRTQVQPEDGKSGAYFELMEIEGVRCFLKVLSYDGDWIMRVTGNTTHWEYKVWRSGLYQRVPRSVDHTMIGMALDESGPKPRLAQLMHDIGDKLIPPGDAPITNEQHAGFMAHMAEFHATFWGWRDDIGLCPTANRLRFFAPDNIATELAAADVPGPIRVANEGWARLPERAPELDRIARSVHADPTALVALMASTPNTFIAGDWKLGNLGWHPEGRSIVLDWAYPGEAPGCYDLCWYLALNSARLPTSKEESIAAYREGLERNGIATADWWDRQLAACIVAIVATFAWEKAVGVDDELGWWVNAATRSWNALDELS